MQKESDHTISLYTETEVIETTAQHPFYVNQEWKDASELQPGDKIKTKDHQEIEIKSTQFNYEPKKVFNFTVANWHTYFVGVLSWLVHNEKLKCIGKALSLLKYWKPKVFKVGDKIIRLSKDDMLHIVERHLKGFRASADKASQTILKNMTPADIEKAIGEVIKQNRAEILKKAAENPKFWGQVEGVVDGVNRTVGFKNGNVGQFF